VDAEVVKAIPDAIAPSDTGPDAYAGTGGDTQTGWGNMTDTQAASGVGIDTRSTSGGGPVDLPDSGAAVPQGQDLVKTSGCSCSVTTPSRSASLLLFAVAGMLAVVVRRSRARR
jgi:MYXO-CTERM domain-containing protein